VLRILSADGLLEPEGFHKLSPRCAPNSSVAPKAALFLGGSGAIGGDPTRRASLDSHVYTQAVPDPSARSCDVVLGPKVLDQKRDEQRHDANGGLPLRFTARPGLFR
jgi:hypothetical protein